jgi:hypothetical protein
MTKCQNSDPRRWYRGDYRQSRWIEAWWVIIGKWSLDRVYEDGIQRGIRMEYQERVLRPRVPANSASDKDRPNLIIPTEKFAGIARASGRELDEEPSQLLAAGGSGLIEVAKSL